VPTSTTDTDPDLENPGRPEANKDENHSRAGSAARRSSLDLVLQSPCAASNANKPPKSASGVVHADEEHSQAISRSRQHFFGDTTLELFTLLSDGPKSNASSNAGLRAANSPMSARKRPRNISHCEISVRLAEVTDADLHMRNEHDAKAASKHFRSPLAFSLDNLRMACARLSTLILAQKIETHRKDNSANPAQQALGGAHNAGTVTEAVMQRVVTKQDFAAMEIVGQFNLGFILTKRNQDLYIIDQHATDEKYRFEQLQLTTTMKTQPLLRPLPLELPVETELVILDNLDCFKANGFAFQVLSESMSPRLLLLTLPFSKNTTFGTDDILQLSDILAQTPGVRARLPKIEKMFASRACRSAVMIGDALSHAQMKKIVHHMSSMEHPWSCPHGRPTMRHVINLEYLNSAALTQYAKALSRPSPIARPLIEDTHKINFQEP
jgi:DNA mismatch repair ATPase MutL